MSRSGYSYDCMGWDLIRWRGAVSSALRGKRGQEFLREMRDALDNMDTKRLVANSLQENGEVCAIGSVGRARGIDMTPIDPEEREQVAEAFGIAKAMAAEIAFINDEAAFRNETPEGRWIRVRAWVESEIKSAPSAPKR